MKKLFCAILVFTLACSLWLPQAVWAANSADWLRAYETQLQREAPLTVTGCTLYDIDCDRVPELIVNFYDPNNTSTNIYKIYTFKNNTIQEVWSAQTVNQDRYLSTYYCFITPNSPNGTLLIAQKSYGAQYSIEIYKAKLSGTALSTQAIANIISVYDRTDSIFEQHLVNTTFALRGKTVSENTFYNSLGYGNLLDLDSTPIYTYLRCDAAHKDHYAQSINFQNTHMAKNTFDIESFPQSSNPQRFSIIIPKESDGKMLYYAETAIPLDTYMFRTTRISDMFANVCTQLMVNGTFTHDASVFEENGVIYLPLRTIAEKTGRTVTWNGQNGSINVIGKNLHIELFANSKNATVNQKVVSLEAPPKVIDGHSFVPLSFVKSHFNVDCEVHTFYSSDAPTTPFMQYIIVENRYAANLALSIGEALALVRGELAHTANPLLAKALAALSEILGGRDYTYALDSIDITANEISYIKSYGRYYVFEVSSCEGAEIWVNKYTGEIYNNVATFGTAISPGLPPFNTIISDRIYIEIFSEKR